MKTANYDATEVSTTRARAFRIALLVVFVAATAWAQVDIPDKEGPDLEPPIGGPGNERICQLCCTGGPSPDCLKKCNCGVAEDPHPCAVAAAVGRENDSSSFQQMYALLTIWDTLVEEYPDHAEAYDKFNARIGKLYLRHPRLARRSAKFIAGIALGVVSPQEGEGSANKHGVTARDLKLLRGILRDLALLDRRENDGALAKAIETMVSPGLGDSLVGRSPMAALDCTLTAKCSP